MIESVACMTFTLFGWRSENFSYKRSVMRDKHHHDLVEGGLEAGALSHASQRNRDA